MKKLFFIAAIAGAALVSCTKNELAPSVTEQQEIAFAAPVVGPQTKAVSGAIDAQYDKGESFDVWSIWHEAELSTGAWAGTPYITDVKASYNEGVNGWRLTTPYYWPATGFLSFVALSPSIDDDIISYAAGTGFQISAWSQGATEEAIVDLMYSNATLNKKYSQFTYDSELDDDNDSGNFKYNGVDIQFNHALSYLVFQVKTVGNYSPTEFRLNAITLSGIYTTGNFKQNPTSSNPNWAVNTEGGVGTYKAYTEGALEFDATAVAVPETDTKEIILLPQTLTASQQTITVDYEISTDGTNWIPQTKSDIVNGTVGAWEMGKKYTYTISIGVDEIIFDPAVSTWTNADGGTITF